MSTSDYTVTFEAEVIIELSDEPDDDRNSRTVQALQDYLGHAGVVINEVLYVN